MSKFLQLLAEAEGVLEANYMFPRAAKEWWYAINGTYLPINPLTMKRIMGLKKIRAFHSLTEDNLDRLFANQNTNRTLSTFTKISSFKEFFAVVPNFTQQRHYIAVLEGETPFIFDTDLWTEPDRNGNRWVSLVAIKAHITKTLNSRQLDGDTESLSNFVSFIDSAIKNNKTFIQQTIKKFNEQNNTSITNDPKTINEQLDGKLKGKLYQMFNDGWVEYLKSSKLYELLLKEMEQLSVSNVYTEAVISQYTVKKLLYVPWLSNKNDHLGKKKDFDIDYKDEDLVYQLKQLLPQKYVGLVDFDQLISTKNLQKIIDANKPGFILF